MPAIQIDHHNIEVLKKAGVVITRHATPDGFIWEHARFPMQMLDALTPRQIADGIEGMHRVIGQARSTVWVDIESPLIYRDMTAAAALLYGFGMGMFVTYQGNASHGPGPLLPDPLRQAVIDTCLSGKFWNPVAGQYVWGSGHFE